MFQGKIVQGRVILVNCEIYGRRLQSSSPVAKIIDGGFEK
jgi:hypothetical protein